MSMGRLSMVAESVGGELVGADQPFDSVSSDTRGLQPGQLFFALRGERFDASRFVDEAERLGAAGAVVESLVDTELPQIVTGDTRAALGRFARSWRRRFELPVIGVTGSNGKTTVRSMIAAILRAQWPDPHEVLATEGNLNNEIGLPLTVLRLRDSHRSAVFEMGANHVGEIAYLADIGAPTVGLVNNAGPAHLEGFGGMDGVARGKGEMFSALPDDGIAIVNFDDKYRDFWLGLCGDRRVLGFGLREDADYRAQAIDETGQDSLAFTLIGPDLELPIRLPMAGGHNLRNALAAAAATSAAGVSPQAVQEGLASTANVGGRLKRAESSVGAVIYDDSYNANPASVRAGMEFLAAQPATTWLVFGDMGELGLDELALHARVGEDARALGIDRLFATGDLSKAAVEAFGAGASHYPDREALADALQAELEAGTVVLVKASRFMGLERVVARLVNGGGC
jgi:UDP-N-acetylmuramoyl-tripeptide--D-alanyl-D-alanine ligase